MDWLRLAIEEFEKRNSISAGMARNQHRELLARIQELETAGRDVVTSVNGSFRQELTIAKLAALLNNTPLEKE